MKNKLQWQEAFDRDGLKMHFAESILHDEGVTFVYRVIKRNGWKLWREDSDSELMAKKNPRKWKSLSEAKRALQRDENNSLSAI